MKERPILFSGTMVRALLDGSKTQTRRAMKPQPNNDPQKHHPIKPYCTSRGQWNWVLAATGHGCGDPFDCPFGQPGDRLWVRETFFAYGRWVTRYNEKKGRDEWHFIDMTIECDRAYQYDADAPDVPPSPARGGVLPGWWRRPAIFMPRAACRMQQEIVSVRVERLNDCSEADAMAEGVIQLDADDCQRPEERTKEGWALCPTCAGTGLHSTLGANGGVNFDVDCYDCDTHAKLYRHLWESINGAGSWDANPWVWVIEFKRIEP